MVGTHGGPSPFADRLDAGIRLAVAVASALAASAAPPLPPVVLGLPRGGVLLAAPVASRLGAPLDVLLVRKLGHPRRPELGLGAIAEDDVRVLNQALIDRSGLEPRRLDDVTAQERAELDRRAARYRQGRPRQPLAGTVAVLVDDGLATGYTALAAVRSARRQGAAWTVLAVPVGAPEAVEMLRQEVDLLVCLLVPDRFLAVGQVYRRFDQVEDDEVIATLERSRLLPPFR